MSEQYPGGYITKSPPTPNGTTAPGLWTLSQQAAYQQQGLWPAPYTPIYIEETFSTYLYTGNGSTQTITNGIDLSTKGGLVWGKNRNAAGVTRHQLIDTVRGANSILSSNLSNAAYDTTGFGSSAPLTAFNTNGFSLGSGTGTVGLNEYTTTYASWTFRKQPKFFDVVTFTATRSGSGWSGGPQVVNHSLGATPGCVIWKATDQTSNWYVHHRSLGNNYRTFLNTTDAAVDAGTPIITPSSTTITFENASAGIVSDGVTVTIVAFLFAHDAGGFGLTGSDNVISCGSFSGGGTTVNLGWEPQWILAKRTDTTGNWYIDDNMRGWPAAGSNDNPLLANTTAAEPTGYAGFANITSTGFTNNFNGAYIYIAIRRGPMKVPTSGASVFGANARSGTGANATVTGGQIADAALIKNRGSAVGDLFASRLTGTGYLETSSTAAEVAAGTTILQANPWDVMDGVDVGTTSTITNASGNTFINYLFRRAPSFFDVVCYTGNGTGGSGRAITHNLGVAPELVIVKSRSNSYSWRVWTTSFSTTSNILLNSNAATNGDFYVWANTYLAVTNPTTQFGVYGDGTTNSTNTSGATYVARLFATCPGVSKVGSYTGTGTTQQINCGFTGGARFVLIKRTDSTGDWYVWDSARGIVAGNDPYLLLNSAAAEVTGTDYVDTYSAGFEISSTAPAGINANGGTYIFLAVA